jgi:putative FmdB family regulatory protein
MPLYEYQCEACGHQFEQIRKFSDPPLEACPVCGGAVQKLMSSPAFQFKGSGWYITDYARKDKPESGGGDSKSADGAKGDKPGEKADAKGETKTDNKTEKKSGDTAAPPAGGAKSSS